MSDTNGKNYTEKTPLKKKKTPNDYMKVLSSLDLQQQTTSYQRSSQKEKK